MHAAPLLASEIERRLRESTQLRLADHEALLALAASKAPMRMTELAEQLAMTRGGITKVVDRLEHLGYVQRQADATDRRSLIVSSTQTGRAAQEQSTPIVDEAIAELWGTHLSTEEAKLLVGIMTRIMTSNPGWTHTTSRPT
ncbi:MAG: MarR family transcriptional regulator [Actinomycetia bacterium]|nr:MarR family transcriptional regulator [Actinomycetes bacterium]